jgi:Mg-chelatase subunit ChlD
MRTSAITLFDSNHGRQRRRERVIATREIQSAIKHGKEFPHPSDPNLLIYQYQGKRHIITRKDRVLVTTMGIRINLKPKYISEQERRNHYRSLNAIRGKGIAEELCSENNNNWSSHSILIVDKSGSMRNSDVYGCRTRLGAVWLSVAQDFIEYRLNAGMAGPMVSFIFKVCCAFHELFEQYLIIFIGITLFVKDVVTVILMGDDAEVLIDRYPTDNILYNLVIKYYHDSEKADILYQKGTYVPKSLIRPAGHGCYGPSLNKAEDLFIKYDNSSAALQLLLLSDGRPSDGYLSRDKTQSALKSRVEKMASRFGKRFNFAAIGMGNMKDYDCLKSMVESCQDYGGNSSLQVPGLSCAEIGAAFSSVATSLMACQTELRQCNGNNSGPTTKKQRRVRTCLRENKRLLPALTEIVDDTFNVYMNERVERYK